jgi:heat shock protein HspQ
MSVDIGDKVEDQISGFEGIVTMTGDHITGCERIGVHPVDNPRRGDQEFFYEAQLDVLEKKVFDEDVVTDVEFDLGNTVRDEITGFEGYVVVINYQLWNCPQVLVQATESDDGEKGDSEWFDAPRLYQISEGVNADFQDLSDKETAETGAVSDAPDQNLSSSLY